MTENNGKSIDWALQLYELYFIGSNLETLCSVYLSGLERHQLNSCSFKYNIHVKSCWIRDLSGDFTQP